MSTVKGTPRMASPQPLSIYTASAPQPNAQVRRLSLGRGKRPTQGTRQVEGEAGTFS